MIKARPSKPIYEFANLILCEVDKKRDGFVPEKEYTKKDQHSKQSSSSSDSSFEEEKERRVEAFPDNTNAVMKQLWDYLETSSSSGASSTPSEYSASSDEEEQNKKKQ